MASYIMFKWYRTSYFAGTKCETYRKLLGEEWNDKKDEKQKVKK